MATMTVMNTTAHNLRNANEDDRQPITKRLCGHIGREKTRQHAINAGERTMRYKNIGEGLHVVATAAALRTTLANTEHHAKTNSSLRPQRASQNNKTLRIHGRGPVPTTQTVSAYNYADGCIETNAVSAMNRQRRRSLRIILTLMNRRRLDHRLTLPHACSLKPLPDNETAIEAARHELQRRQRSAPR